MKFSIVLPIVVFLSGIASNEALQCYVHSICSANCPQLDTTIQTCPSDETRCYKAAFPGGVSRGCGKDRCNVQVNAHSTMANVCCETNLCNSALSTDIPMKTSLMLIASVFIVFVIRRL